MSGPTSARRAVLPWLAALAVGYALTYPLSDYQLFQLTRVTTTALAVASLVLLTGLSGQISAGQGAAFGLGAYTCAILITRTGMPWPLAALAAAGVCLLAGLLLGLPALRLGGLNLGLVTLAVAVLFPLVASRWEGLTGGSFGLVIPPVHPPGGVRLSSAQFLYVVTLLALFAVLAAAAAWTRGRTGRALAALRTNPTMAATQGVATARLSVLVVGIAMAMAGLGGALNAVALQSAIPDAYVFQFSLALLTGAVVGGVRSWAGAVIGAAYVVYLPQVASDVVGSTSAGQWAQVGYAATLLITLYFAPTGIAGAARAITRRIRTRPRQPEQPTASQPSASQPSASHARTETPA